MTQIIEELEDKVGKWTYNYYAAKGDDCFKVLDEAKSLFPPLIQLIRDMQARIGELEGKNPYYVPESTYIGVSLHDKIVTELREENARLRESLGWQDISTAPKDGTEILIYTTNSKQIPLHWRKQTLMAKWDDRLWGWLYGFNLVTPTHWMRLPQPPKDIEHD